MTEQTDRAFSRPGAVAELLVGHSINREEILRRKAALLGEAEALTTRNGKWCFLNAIRLLPRICGDVTIFLPELDSSFKQEIMSLIGSVWKIGTLECKSCTDDHDLGRFSAILNIGVEAQIDLPWTTINSNGWVARVSSNGCRLPSDMDKPNPLGALMATSLGVTEVFKRLYGVSDSVAPPLDLIEFSLYSLTTSPNTTGPDLPVSIAFPDSMLIGGGAIGNGIVLLLSQLGARGRLHIVDKQVFGDENLGTCMLLDDAEWIGDSKASRLASWLSLRSGFRVSEKQELIKDARCNPEVEGMSIELILNGLDDSSARHDAQLFWPSVLVDGGINAVGAGVVSSRIDHPEGACLRCTFSLPSFDERSLQATATGLSIGTLTQDLHRPLELNDIELADESKRSWLLSQMSEGKTICATISEAQKTQLGLNVEMGFRPSAPFVAAASASLVIGEALKALFYPDSEFNHSFQIANVFLGPLSSSASLRKADHRCECVTQRHLIEELPAVRHRRQQSNALPPSPA
jgi:hypothetical protein